jgi:N-acetylmuramoyl-L-alanine amidase
VPSSAALPQVPRRTGPLNIQVVYPTTDASLQFRDSTFIFGSVGTGEARLTINGQTVPVWPDGAWLAYLSLSPDTVARFQLEARSATDSASLTYIVRRTMEESSPPPGATLWVDSSSLSPRGRVWLHPDEYLPLSVRATEGAVVYLRLPDGTAIPLVAQPQLNEVSEGVRVFGGGHPESWRRDRYTGVVRGRSIGPDPGPVLPGGGFVHLVAATGDSAWATVEAVLGADTVRIRWPLQVALLDTLPEVVEFDDDTAHLGSTDSTSVGRAAPGATYAWFFPTGTRAEVSGRRDGDLRVRLSRDAEAWVPATDARLLPAGTPEPRGLVESVVLTPSPGYVTLRVPLSQRLPFRISEGDRTLIVHFYGAAGDLNFMRYGVADTLVRRMSWDQTAGDEVTLTLELSRPVWGYRARWDGNDLLVDVRRPPAIDQGNPLSGRLIAVDPGHPPGGATGPTGLREAEANLAVALELRRLLESAGAKVLMTRTTDTSIELWPRVAAAEQADADLLVSIHNNALPDGINPFAHNGSSVYYNHERSIPLAHDVQQALLERLGLRDLGIGRGDFALVRGTWMPSILTEGLFMMVPDQEAALRSPRGQQLYALAVFDGLRRFLGERAQDQ